MTDRLKFLTEAFEHLRSLGKVHTQKEFAEKIGFDRSNLSSAFNGKEQYLTDGLFERICNTYPDLFNLEYFLEDKGEMLKNNTGNNAQLDKSAPYRLVPLVNLDFVGGMHGNSEVTPTDAEYVMGMVPFNDALETDICVSVTGDSMSPTCPPGSIVLIREVAEWREYFGFGNIFCLLLNDGRRLLKEINRFDENHKEYVLCVSHNKSVPPEELPRNMIAQVWKVVKILTDKGW
jgi:phage repressor protein C with HTH and peptisase S24 domain